MRLTDFYGKLRPEDLEPTGLPEARAALACFERTSAERVGLTCGGALALTAAIKTIRIRSEATSVLCPRPHFPGYPSIAALEGFETEYYNLDPVLWQPSIEEISRQLEVHRPAAILLNSPHNPTGVILRPQMIQAIIEVAAKTQTFVIMDEAFAGLSYSENFIMSSTFPEQSHVIRIGSLNKRFPMMADDRLGYLIAEPGFLRDASLIHRTMAIGANIESQFRATELLNGNPGEILRTVASELREQRDEACKILGASGCFDFHIPEGGLFLWLRLPNEVEPYAFRDTLWSRCRIWCAAGPRFGWTTENRIRFRFGIPQKLMRTQCKAIKRFVECEYGHANF